MGNIDSKQQLGERVITARRKLEEDRKLQQERLQFFQSKSPQTMKVMMESIEEAFKSHSPFLESVLLVAYKYNPVKCQKVILSSCKKVLKAPIIKQEYEWFQQYVFPSSVWMFETKPNHYMYQELLGIANDMSSNIIESMDNIYEHLKHHSKWEELMNIKNQTYVSRQDHKNVGLLQKGIQDIVDEKDDKTEEMRSFIDSNIAVNILTTTAKNINDEFQNHVKIAMSEYGLVADGPIKKVDRCQSKLENDYADAKFPSAAKLLDLVRCSVTFNTLHQLIDGYNGLISHIQKNPSIIELARVKNGFLDEQEGGYRDIKLNVIYHSQTKIGAPVSMICEIQLLFGQYLHEKKRIHKLYNVLRQNVYFNMVVDDKGEEQKTQLKDMKDLKLTPVLNVAKEVKMSGYPFNGRVVFRCCMDLDTQLLAVEGDKWYGCIDTNTKKPIWEQKTDLKHNGRHTANWIVSNNEKYLSIKTEKNTIKMFKVRKDNDSYSFEEDEKFGITLPSKDDIYFCEFDTNFENVMIVKNGDTLEKRSVNNISVVKKSIQLQEKVQTSSMKQLSLSNDGNCCILAGGYGKKYSYFTDIENDKQFKLESSSGLDSVYAPSFINGETKYAAFGIGPIDEENNLEIWDVAKKELVKCLKIPQRIFCTASTNNILAVGSCDKMLRLYDVRNWEMFYSQKYDMPPISIHLTSNSKYVTIGGSGGEKCVVLQIQ